MRVDRQANYISRRQALALLGTGAIAGLLGCQDGDHPDIGDSPKANELDPALKAVTGAAPQLIRAGDVLFLSCDTTHSVPILPRERWARAGPDVSRTDPMDGVRLLMFKDSHDPVPFMDDSIAGTAQHLEYVREYYHSRNFSDIGWHFAIDRVGRIWELRSLAYEPQAVRDHNPHLVAIVVLGNFDLQQMTPQQKLAIMRFGRMLRTQFNLPISSVYTKQELVPLTYSDKYMQPFMVQIRQQGLI